MTSTHQDAGLTLSRGHARAVVVTAAGVLLAVLSLAPLRGSPPPRDTAAQHERNPARTPAVAVPGQQGLYTPEQAERGRALYLESCATCHGRSLRGSETGPPIVGAGFILAWEGRTVGELLEYVSAEMPPGSGGRLSDDDYVDVIAYMLEQNRYPEGDEELTAVSPLLEKTEIRLGPPPDDARPEGERHGTLEAP